MRQIIFKESAIVNFFANINIYLMRYFRNSIIHRSILRMENIVDSLVLKNAKRSLFIRLSKKAKRYFSLKDFGLFIAMVVVFNTILMVILKKEIDIYSISARIFFLIAGMVLLSRKVKK